MKLHTRVIGKGEGKEWVVLLHGIGGTSKVWFKQVRVLSERFQVLLVDLPSHGKSEGIQGTQWSLEDCVDVLEEEMKQQGIEECHVMGVSLGTLLIHRWVRRVPERFLSVIQVGSVIQFNRLGKVLRIVLNTIKGKVPMKWLYPLAAWVLLPKRNHKESRELFIRESKEVENKEFVKWLGVLNEVEGSYMDLSEAGMPYVYVSGDEDHMFKTGVEEWVGEDRVTWLKGVGHVCNVEGFKRFNQVIDEFYDRLQVKEHVQVS